MVALNDIYHDSFPPDQIDPLTDLRPQFVRGRQHLLVAYDDTTPIGFAIAQPFQAVAGYYARYIAVARTRRNHGVGTAIMKAMLAVAERGGHDFIVFEVDPPFEQGLSADEIDARKERLALYYKRGVIPLPCIKTFLAPAFHDRTARIAYQLLWVPLAAQPADEAQVRQVVRTLLVEGYALPQDATLVHENMQRINCDVA